jgi:phytanoyl-CoA dioxygenase PhyH
MSILSRIDSRFRLRASLEDHLTTRPSPLFTPAFRLEGTEQERAQAAVREIERNSAFFAGVQVGPDELAMLRPAMEEAYDGRRLDLRVEVNPRTGIAQIHDPLRLHASLIRLASNPFLCGIVERYLRRRVFLADVDMRRVPPMAMTELDRRAGTKTVGTTSSHWHRDIRGRQVKIMVYLTGVGEADSNFAFIPGTHQGHHIRPRVIEQSRFTDEWVQTSGLKPVECYGPPGLAMVFDTNLIHRLRRKATGIVRDSITFYYTPGQELRRIGIGAGELTGLPPAAAAIFGGRRPVSAH